MLSALSPVVAVFGSPPILLRPRPTRSPAVLPSPAPSESARGGARANEGAGDLRSMACSFAPPHSRVPTPYRTTAVGRSRLDTTNRKIWTSDSITCKQDGQASSITNSCPFPLTAMQPISFEKRRELILHKQLGPCTDYKLIKSCIDL
jgi:hypothetical protein